jgi:hypothetical protein
MVHVQYFPANSQGCTREERERAAQEALQSRLHYEETRRTPPPGHTSCHGPDLRWPGEIDRDAPL